MQELEIIQFLFIYVILFQHIQRKSEGRRKSSETQLFLKVRIIFNQPICVALGKVMGAD